MRNRQIIFSSDYTKQFLHGKRADYCVYGDGTVTRTWKVSMKEEVVRPYGHDGKMVVKCGGKEFVVKHLVAWAFLPRYKKGRSVVCVDGNERNCAMDNLCIMTSKQLGRITGELARSQKIRVTHLSTGTSFVMNSIRKAAKSLYVSYQTVINYMKNPHERSILSGFKIEVIG